MRWAPGSIFKGDNVVVFMISKRAPSAKLKKQDSNPFTAFTYAGPPLAPK